MGTKGNGKKVPLNVYLLKEKSGASWDDKDVIASPIGAGGKPRKIQTEKHFLGPEGSYGTLFIRKPINETEPNWLNYVSPGLDQAANTQRWKNKSVSAILLVNCSARQFVIAFGHGRYMIEPRLIEDRFGIKVVLNSVSPDRITSIDRQTFDASPRVSRTQTIKASSVSDYMINAEQDLLRGLVGFTKSDYSEVLGPLIAGIDSFKASVSGDLADLRRFLDMALKRSASKDYLAKTTDGHNSEFSWVENLLPVKDKDFVAILEQQLWGALESTGRQNMWLAIPDIVDWSNVDGFSYRAGAEKSDVQQILDLDGFMDTLRKNATLETVKRRDIYIAYTDGRAPGSFSAFKCIYAEIKHNTKLYILHAGSWFSVEASFQASVEKYFTEMQRKEFSAPFLEYDHIGEGKYNEDVCAGAIDTHAMLDRKLIQFGGSYDKIEVCDIYRKQADDFRGEFIHVKRGRGSSSLSHLFAQGLVASTLLVRERAFVKDVNKQLAKQGFSHLPEVFEAKGYDVVYAIIDGEHDSQLDLPFFSKVTLQNCGKTITSYGFTVRLLHIPESAAHRAKKAAKIAVKTNKKSAKASKGRKTKAS
ncbi:MAG: DUF6119 family protein [Halopseudomonas sabulinigri]|jgi:uncharacterized protein (TIGR04141 family)